MRVWQAALPLRAWLFSTLAPPPWAWRPLPRAHCLLRGKSLLLPSVHAASPSCAPLCLPRLALALALDAMDCHQSGRAGCPLQTSTAIQAMTYSLQIQVQTRPGLALEDLQVRVQWPAMGPAWGAAGVGLSAGSPGQTQPRMGELVLYSSRDAVPSWIGVSLP